MANKPRPVTAAKAPKSTDDLDASVPVFGNSCFELAAVLCETGWAVDCSWLVVLVGVDEFSEFVTFVLIEVDWLTEVDVTTDAEIDSDKETLTLCDSDMLSLKLTSGL